MDRLPDEGSYEFVATVPWNAEQIQCMVHTLAGKNTTLHNIQVIPNTDTLETGDARISGTVLSLPVGDARPGGDAVPARTVIIDGRTGNAVSVEGDTPCVVTRSLTKRVYCLAPHTDTRFAPDTITHASVMYMLPAVPWEISYTVIVTRAPGIGVGREGGAAYIQLDSRTSVGPFRLFPKRTHFQTITFRTEPVPGASGITFPPFPGAEPDVIPGGGGGGGGRGHVESFRQSREMTYAAAPTRSGSPPSSNDTKALHEMPRTLTGIGSGILDWNTALSIQQTAPGPENMPCWVIAVYKSPVADDAAVGTGWRGPYNARESVYVPAPLARTMFATLPAGRGSVQLHDASAHPGARIASVDVELGSGTAGDDFDLRPLVFNLGNVPDMRIYEMVTSDQQTAKGRESARLIRIEHARVNQETHLELWRDVSPDSRGNMRYFVNGKGAQTEADEITGDTVWVRVTIPLEKDSNTTKFKYTLLSVSLGVKIPAGVP